MHDLVYAVRVAVKRPVFSVAVVLTLAVGIGASTTVFSLVNTVLLRPLPYPNSERLYFLLEEDSLGSERQLPSYPTFQDWHRQSDVFDALVFVRGTGLTVQTDDRSGLLLTAFVSEDFFQALDVAPLTGRTFGPENHATGSPKVAVLAHRAWRNTFGGDPDLVGTTITVGNEAVTVLGIMPPAFTYPVWGEAHTDLWMPMSALPPMDLAALQQRDVHVDSRAIGLLKERVTLGTAQAQMNAIATRLAVAYPDMGAQWTRVFMMPLKEFAVRQARAPLWTLTAATTVVLLIVCVNLGTLYLTQSAARSQEFAIRVALGAGQARVVRQLLSETLLLTSAGGAIGVLTAGWLVALLRAFVSDWFPRMNELQLDMSGLALALGLSVFTAILFAFVGLRRDVFALADALGSRGVLSRRASRRSLPGGLVVAQVSLAVMLLVGAGLLIQSFWRLSHVDPGFAPRNLLSIWIAPPSPTYDDPNAALRLYDDVADAVRAVPGVTDVGLINHAPLSGGGIPSRAARGAAPGSSDDYVPVLPRTVSAGYFGLMGIPVLEGREFDDGDIQMASGPVIVNDVLAQLWGDDSPVGEQLTVLKAAKERADFGEPLTGTVIGVVGSVKQFGLDSRPAPVVYLPYTATPWSTMSIVARTAAQAQTLVRPVNDAVRRIDPAIPLDGARFFGARVATDIVRESYADRRFNALLVTAFSAAALLLAAIGVYGTLAYAVTSQSREIGIRLALGAAPRSIERAVLLRAARLTALGVVLGIAAALGLARFVRSMLFEVQPSDPLTYIVMTIMLVLVAGAASFLPARRAASVDPLVALRSE